MNESGNRRFYERMYPGISEKGELGWVSEREVRAALQEQNRKVARAARNVQRAAEEVVAGWR